MTDAAKNEPQRCTGCRKEGSPVYRIGAGEKLCPGCLAEEYERGTVIQSAYVNWLRTHAPKENPDCRTCGGSGLIHELGGGGAVRCPACKEVAGVKGEVKTCYFGTELGTQPIEGDGNVPLAESSGGDLKKFHRALAFAASVIKSGESWTETCEKEIGSLLARTP